MNLRFRAPKFLRNILSRKLSNILSEEYECEAHVQIHEMEIGMRNKNVYIHSSVDTDINRRDLMRIIKDAIKG